MKKEEEEEEELVNNVTVTFLIVLRKILNILIIFLNPESSPHPDNSERH